MNQAFLLEYKRSKLAKGRKLKELTLTYTKKEPEIPDLNTARFWDERLYIYSPLKEQDGMTRDRVKSAARFLLKELQEGARILDIGIGEGWIEELLIPRKVKLYGNDISPEAIKNIKKRFKGNFSVQSLYNMSYKKNYFDAIFLLEVLEHVPPRKTLSVLKHIHSLLKPEGIFVISVPLNEGLEKMKNNPNGHVRVYSPDLIKAELDISGFKVLEQKFLYAFPNFYKLKTLLSKLINKWEPNNIVLKTQKKHRVF